MGMEIISLNQSFGGHQLVVQHDSVQCNCEMKFAIYLPPNIQTEPCPVLWYLSGLTCTHANVMEKGEYRRAAARHGLVIVCPDTSPRGNKVPDEQDNWQFGSGAGFYLDATQQPWSKHYNMYSYVVKELPQLVNEHFNVDLARQSIFGHSMGGHGALVMALKNPETYRSCSAFAPIVEPSSASWSANAFKRYLGGDEQTWRSYDACALVQDGARFGEFLIDQGMGDDFLETGLRPWLFEDACKSAKIDLDLRMHDGYDHSYYFISTFMEDHVNWHAERLK